MQERFIENLILRTYEGKIEWKEVPLTEHNQQQTRKLEDGGLLFEDKWTDIFECKVRGVLIRFCRGHYVLPEIIAGMENYTLSVNNGEISLAVPERLAAALLTPLLKQRLYHSEKLLLDLVTALG
jgi:hypothetical protein